MSLDDLRNAIDALDSKLIAAFNERARLAQEIGRIKQGDKFRPEREVDVLRRAKAANAGPLDDATVARLLRELMSACLRLESPMQVAFLGPAGTYTEDALRRFFGDGVEAAPVESIEAVFDAVESGKAANGVVPVENSSQGLVTPTLARFVRSKVKICGELVLPIQHQLLGRGEPTVIRGHQQALAQCRRWLDANHPNVPREAVASNAEAARLATDGGAAVASRRAGELYGLGVLAADIADDATNETRFLILGQNDVPATGHDKTTVVLAARNKPGALLDLLRPFADAGVNIARIQTVPAPDDTWQDHFFVDIDGHADDLQDVLKVVASEAALYSCLGSYPVGAL